MPMRYALFQGTVRISEMYLTETEVWVFTRQNDYCTEVVENEDMPARRVLRPGFHIHTCDKHGKPLTGG